MSSQPPPWLDPQPGNLRSLLRGVLALGALFVIAFALTRDNRNAGIFIVLAVVCLGLAVVSLFARGVQRFGGSVLNRMGRSERDLIVGGLLLIALLTPWSIAVPTLHSPQIFGWQSPVAAAVVVALVLTRARRLRRIRQLAIVAAGLGLAAWVAWLGMQLLTPAFRSSGFPFLPIDLIGEGWYIGLAAMAVSVDGMAVDASDEDRPARPGEVWPFSMVPGMGLVRMHYLGRGRLWLAAVAFFTFLLQATVIGADEFQYYGSLGSLPAPRPRSAALIPLIFGILTWLASLWDTRQKLRLEKSADQSLAPSIRRPDSDAV